MIPLIGAALVAAVLALYLDQRAERSAAAKRATQQQALIVEVLEELVSLRSALVASGDADRTARLPPAAPEAGSRPPPRPPAVPFPSVERKVVSVTRDDDPVHTRATIEAPAPDGWGEPPSTKPSTSQARPRERPSVESSPIFEDDNRPTEVFGDDEQTRVFSKRPGDADARPGVSVRRKPVAPLRPPPPAPPRPRSERPTLYDGMLRAPPVAPTALAPDLQAPPSRTSMKTMPSAVAPAVRDAVEREREGGSA